MRTLLAARSGSKKSRTMTRVLPGSIVERKISTCGRSFFAIASAICYRDAGTLYGRHWGCAMDVPGLHFELCYYQGIDYCIRNGLQRFEPGAQGEHKLARGFEPVPTWSAFWIADPRMRQAVADFVIREDAAMQDYEAETASRLPFRQEA